MSSSSDSNRTTAAASTGSATPYPSGKPLGEYSSARPGYRIILSFKLQFNVNRVTGELQRHNRIFDSINVRYLYRSGERHDLLSKGDDIISDIVMRNEHGISIDMTAGVAATDAGHPLAALTVHAQYAKRCSCTRHRRCQQRASRHNAYDRAAHLSGETEAQLHLWTPEIYKSMTCPLMVKREVDAALVDAILRRQSASGLHTLRHYLHFDFDVEVEDGKTKDGQIRFVRRLQSAEEYQAGHQTQAGAGGSGVVGGGAGAGVAAPPHDRPQVVAHPGGGAGQSSPVLAGYSCSISIMASQYSQYNLPGAYPGSIPPTPADESVPQSSEPQYEPAQQQRVSQPEQVPDYHEHHSEYNKLHTINDPRGHAHTDSGVGLTEHVPIHKGSLDKSNWQGPSEAVGGGTYVRDTIEPVSANDSARKHDQPLQELWEEAPRKHAHNEGTQATPGATERGVRVGDQTSQPGATQASTHQVGHLEGGASDDAAPYWGSLPKAAGGGIYNTVTGHGSANDDHDQHHHIPQRSADSQSPRSHVVGSADFPRGGVYNGVAGHGSQDEESMRHSLSNKPDDSDIQTVDKAGPAAGVATLPEIREGEKKTDFTPTNTNTAPRNIAPGFLPETAVRDDAALLAASNHGPNPEQKTETAHPRAFPLTTTQHSTEPEKQEGRKRSNSKTTDKVLPLASAALIADGAAHGLPAKNQSDTQQAQPLPSQQETRHSRRASEDQGHHTVGGILTHQSRDDKRASSVDKHRRHSEQSPSPKGEKKHKILGIFSRNKDETPTEDTSTYDRGRRSDDHTHDHTETVSGVAVGTKNNRNVLRKASLARKASPEASSSSEQSDHRNEKAAAGIAAGAGAAGLLHHKKDSDDLRADKRHHERSAERSPITSATPPTQHTTQHTTQHALQPQRNTEYSSHPNQPLTSQQQPTSQQGKTASRGTSYPNAFAGAVAAGAGTAVGLDAYERTQKHHDTEEITTPFEHPREPPFPPNTNTTHNASSASRGHNTQVVYNTLPSGSSPTSHGKKDVAAKDTDNYNVMRSSGAPSGAPVSASEYEAATRESTQHPVDPNYTGFGIGYKANKKDADTPSHGAKTASHPLGPNVAPTGIAHESRHNDTARSTSPPKHSSDSRALGGAAVSQAAGQYNQLPSGTASGVRQEQSHLSGSGPSTEGVVTQGDDYSHLPSGTASGVQQDSKIGGHAARSNAGADATRPSQSRTDSGPYNKLASGTPSGVKIKPKEHRTRQSTEPFVPARNEHDVSGREQFNSLPSANVASGFGQDASHMAHADNSERTYERKDLPLPASSSSPTQANPSSHHTVLSAPVHAAPETGKQTNPRPPADQLATAQFTPFPNPELMQNMSPEVMPDAYRESVSSSHLHSSPLEHKMSPEVIPAAYSASHTGATRAYPTAARYNQPDGSAERYLNPSSEGLRTMPSSYPSSATNSDSAAVDPALAAANASWASTTGKTGDRGLWSSRQSKVIHKCDHCGQDNDISGYLKK
ncbi:hypothetical protein QBC35DRAFT_535960 [Podospora australis]|uniref:Uncharacterized protein n=1 Tax=Podospora australis TaxID=1536484 RepID=A0AAN6WJV1_9PEZI|nr:hypothetical protein QBC35DRAFT_535960 [Podospora australis]